MSPRYTADDISRALGSPHLPTAEQRAVIEAPLRPVLVVAGAGSGKTETMAARVVWLVANGFVEADQVLGLTFTRKAATELAERVTLRLRRLQQAGLWSPPEEDGAETLGGTPTVSTYHSYAGRLVREHALRLGVESDSRLLSEAAAWQYANEAVLAHDGPMEGVTRAESTITNAVVDLAGELAEHLLTPGDVAAYLDELDAALASLPGGRSRGSALGTELSKVRADLREQRAVLPVLERYLALKRERDAMDFADQIALAARLASTFPDIGAIERHRFRAVLLDEFQDTSEAQLVLLASLFAGAGEDAVPVTAVGDPHQSIYAWRGASATTLGRFPRMFADGDDARVLPLSTSWRNATSVLDAANHVAAPLRAESHVPVTTLRAAPGAGRGTVETARLETTEDEAALVADWVRSRREEGAGSAAVLCRRRSQFGGVVEALQDRGLPVEVVGLGGLLLTPEVEDVVALLHVVQDPTRGDQLMRLVTGPLCRLGPADLDGLMAWARHQQQLRLPTTTAGTGPGVGDDDPGEGPGANGSRPRVDLEPETADVPSIVEALDDLPAPGWTGREGERLSGTARERLAGLARSVRRLREIAGLPLAELVGEAERALGLDVEVLARPGYSPAAARAHLDAFADVAASFSVSADRPTLGGFLSWLAAALEEERGLDKGNIEVSPDAVQVLTVHAAKGLEWDVVAVPGLVEATFPEHSGRRSSPGEQDAAAEASEGGRPAGGANWTHGRPRDRGWTGGIDGVPYDLRGDRAGLPHLDWRTAEDADDLKKRYAEFLEAGGLRGIAEERRLAYVALTRARTAMLLTAPVWAAPSTPRVTSRFLEEVAGEPTLAAARLVWAPMPEPGAANPRTAEPLRAAWPRDPTAQPEARRRLADIEAAAARVRSAMADAEQAPGADPAADPTPETPVGDPPDGGADEVEVELLLAERDRARRPARVEVEAPAHLSTSALVALAEDPEAFALALRRPMPAPPASTARRGTTFHAWVEQHYARAAIVDVLELPGNADEDPADDEDLPRLRENFLASEWAERTPLEVELAVETVVAGVAVRGRIDAVFPRPDGGVTVVDWKTGPPPTGDDARARDLQLAAYRLAYARLRGLDPEQVDAAFFHAATGLTRWPEPVGADRLAEVLTPVRGR